MKDELKLMVISDQDLLFILKVVRIFDKLVFRTKVTSILQEVVDGIDIFLQKIKVGINLLELLRVTFVFLLLSELDKFNHLGLVLKHSVYSLSGLLGLMNLLSAGFELLLAFF